MYVTLITPEDFAKLPERSDRRRIGLSPPDFFEQDRVVFFVHEDAIPGEPIRMRMDAVWPIPKGLLYAGAVDWLKRIVKDTVERHLASSG